MSNVSNASNRYTDHDWEEEPTNGKGTRTVHGEMVAIHNRLDFLPSYADAAGAANWFRDIRLAAKRAERALRDRASKGPRIK